MNSLTPQLPAPPPPEPPPLNAGVLGTVDTLSEAEEAELMACEAVISMGWRNFVDVGQALARIQEKQLYRNDFASFEAYCRCKWQYGRRYAYQLIQAAEVITQLCANAHTVQPASEFQIRPLVGLSPELTNAAWDKAVEMAAGRPTTAKLVKSAIKALQQAQTTDTTVPTAAAAAPMPTKSELRKLIDATLGELLVLLSQKAAHHLLTEKVKTLHQHIQAVFRKSGAR